MPENRELMGDRILDGSSRSAGDQEGKASRAGARSAEVVRFGRRLTSAAAGTRHAIDGRARPCVIGRGPLTGGLRDQGGRCLATWLPYPGGHEKLRTLEPGAETLGRS